MSDANNCPVMADTADKSDRWTVRGIGAATRRKAADMAAKADMPLGRWLSRLIEQAADKSAMADIPAGVFGAVLARLERLERVMFLADVADVADMKSAVVIAPGVADTANMADTETPLEAAGVPAGAVDAVDAVAGADDSTDVPGATGAARKRLAGDAKAERAAEIKRRLAAGESKPDIMSALRISLATLNRALAE